MTVTYPGGDITTRASLGSISAADATQYLGMLEQQIGLAPGASLSSLVQALHNKMSGATPTVPAPPAFSGGSLSASDFITATVPASDVPANVNNLPGWLAGFLGELLGGLASALVFTVRVGIFAASGVILAAAPWVTSLCTAVAFFFWSFVGIIFFDWATGVPLDTDAWLTILTYSLTSAALGAGWPYLSRGVVWLFARIFGQVIPGTVAAVTSLEPAIGAAGAEAAAATATTGLTAAERAATPATLGTVVAAAGMAAPAGTGTVASGFAGNCMDAYGASGGASPGQVVAINACNGNPNQDWTTWSDGAVSVWGMCLDTNGGTDSNGAKLTDLEFCDGSSSQVWSQVGGAMVNKATGACLDDPNANISPGTRLRLWPCNGSPAQEWTLPAEPKAPTGSVCDIYAYYDTRCVAAYSTTRALFNTYNGPLYQVQRASDGATADIGLLSAGGDVNAAEQDSFCSGTSCTITEIYDQSLHGNNLTIEGPGRNGGQDRGADASALPITIGGNKAYGVDIEPGVGYRDDNTSGIATNGEPEGMYMVASGTHVNSGCCFDFGNVETNNTDNGDGHMDAVNLTTWCGGNSQPCTGNGPWVEADMENGQWMGKGPNPGSTGNATPFVTAVLENNGQNTFALEGGDSTSGGLSQWYEGALPPGYAPMHQEGAIVLGTGGDNSNSDVGSWFEGVMTAGFPGAAAENAVQQNIVSAGYAGSTNPGPGGGGGSGGGGGGGGGGGEDDVDGVTPSPGGPAVVHSAGAIGQGAYGFSSVYTVDASNGHLQETYLPAMYDSWTTQDLSAKYGTPPVMAGTQPVSIVHCGYTSLYTVDAGSGDLQETYLPAIGGPWYTQDLSSKYGTPPTNTTPTAVVHYSGAPGATAGCGFTSVYTIDASSQHLQETYLPNAGFPGDHWTTQDLSAKYGTPPVQSGTAPVSIVHCGYTSLYTVDAGSGDPQETYLPSIGGPWSTQSLSAKYGTPPTNTTPTAVVHYAGAPGATTGCGFTSVYTIDASSQHLQETYLPNAGFPGDPWTTQDLSAKYGTPPVLPGTQPEALVHMGYTSVDTVDQSNDQLQETYLPSIGGPWSTQSLSAKYGTPVTGRSPIVLLHPDQNGNLDWTSVFTINAGSGDLQETYLPTIGGPWYTQDLSAKYGTPQVRMP